MKSMASAVSPSASAQVLPHSKTIMAENSCLRARSKRAPPNRTSARDSGDTVLHVWNVAWAAVTAWSASCAVALAKRPITREGFEGSVESNVGRSLTGWPPMVDGHVRPSSPATFFRAASNAARCSGLLKSVKGSFLNSGRAMGPLLREVPRTLAGAGMVTRVNEAANRSAR